MGNPKWSYEDMVREADRIITYSKKRDEDTSIEDLELRLKSYDHDNEFYFNCGIAAANITDDIFANGGCDDLNAAIGGLIMFRDLIGLELEEKVAEMDDVKSNSAYGEEYERKVYEFNRKWIEDEFKEIDILIENISKLINLLETNEEKVKRRRILYDLNDKPYAIKGDCPRCGNGQLVSISEQYCPKCGQKLDWIGVKMISAEKMRKYFSRKYSDRNTAKMITKEIKINIEYGIVDPTFVGKWYKGLSEGTIRILMKKGYIIIVGEDRHKGELGVLFRDVDEDNYIGQLYVLPDEKSVSKEE